MSHYYQKVGIIGSGVMGAQLAAIFAGAGCDVELLDIVPAQPAIAKLSKMKPPPLYVSSDIKKIRAGNLDNDLARLKSCDWIIEVVVEKADVKKAIYSKLQSIIKKDAIVTSNTSSIVRRALIEGMDRSFARRFFITHFFNPPRFMKLVELSSGQDADKDAENTIERFLREKLGKGVVKVKDSPLFIANRIGLFHVLDVMQYASDNGWPIEAVDAVLGIPCARPKSAIFRTADLAGLDTVAFVAAELVKNCPDDEAISRCRIPQFLQQMLVNGQLGDKTGRGFYFKDKSTGQVQSFDLKTQNYRPKVNFKTPSIGEALKIQDLAKRVRSVVFSSDQAGEIAWPAISDAIVYAANRIPEISDDIYSVDCAMRWGYHWELGPFEVWDALGIKDVVVKLEKEGRVVPKLIEGMLSSGQESFYKWQQSKKLYFDIKTKQFREIEDSEKRTDLGRLKELKKTVDENAGASLIDIGDGIFVCEFHTKMNSIDDDVISMLNTSVDRVEKEGQGLLIANDGENFSVGANLLLVLIAAQQKRWDEIKDMVRKFQAANQRLRFAKKPVMAVPFGMTLGGGCEMCLATPFRTPSIETYIGLVEVGAGVIPAGCGCKNLLLMMESNGKLNGPQPKVSAAFELIATARVASSARDGVNLGLLSKSDKIVMDRDYLIFEAKKKLIEVANGYKPLLPRTDILLPGRGGEMALTNALRGFVATKKATEYDAFIARKLAHVLSGGDCPTIHLTTEEHILDMELEAFLSLVGEEKTQARMASLLQTGKPLRN